jgi:hypothetical protein
MQKSGVSNFCASRKFGRLIESHDELLTNQPAADPPKIPPLVPNRRSLVFRAAMIQKRMPQLFPALRNVIKLRNPPPHLYKQRNNAIFNQKSSHFDENPR